MKKAGKSYIIFTLKIWLYFSGSLSMKFGVDLLNKDE